eukprot:520420_1
MDELNESEAQQPINALVVHQQQFNAQEQVDQDNRFSRWAYLAFGIGMAAYNFLSLIFWFGTLWWGSCAHSVDNTCSKQNPLKPLLFFCGVGPSFIGFLWMIYDATIFCAKPGNGCINGIWQEICSCECANAWSMALPMATAATLRFVLWCTFFGQAAIFLNEYEAEEMIDNVFWLIVCVGSVDVGPFILCTIDWWWYYGKRDYNGLFGHKFQPLRCITAESIIIMIGSWALIAFFGEYADDAAEFIWPWVLHGIVSTAILIFAAFLQYSGSIQGAYVSNIPFKFVCWGFGIIQGVLILIVCGCVLNWALKWSTDEIPTLILIIYAVGLTIYYAGLTIPISWCLFSIQTNQQNDDM